jgi:NADH-ubiquinone oxidoreductase chain 1
MNILLDVIELLIFLVAILFSVAYITVAERKTMAYMQRRLGPNAVGWYGLLQAFADAIKLLLKEIIIPKESNKYILILAPFITFISAWIGWVVIPMGPGIVLSNMTNGILFTLSVSSVGVFGTLLSGWSSNSKYAFLGTIRSTAQLISYELVLTTIIIVCLLLNSQINYTGYIESQRIILLCIPLLPLMAMFYISTIAETNRPPFDLVEAESELVAGYFTEYSASPFIFFFLAEYSNILFMAILTSILFLGHYLVPMNLVHYISYLSISSIQYTNIFYIIEGLIYGAVVAIKSIILVYTYIWIRASYPRYTFDNLINLCWTVYLPILFAIIILIPTILYAYNALS